MRLASVAVPEKLQQALWHPVEMAWQLSGDKADVAALVGEVESYLRRHLVWQRQRVRRQEGVVTGVEQQGRNGDVAEPGFA